MLFCASKICKPLLTSDLDNGVSGVKGVAEGLVKALPLNIN